MCITPVCTTYEHSFILWTFDIEILKYWILCESWHGLFLKRTYLNQIVDQKYISDFMLSIISWVCLNKSLGDIWIFGKHYCHQKLWRPKQSSWPFQHFYWLCLIQLLHNPTAHRCTVTVEGVSGGRWCSAMDTKETQCHNLQTTPMISGMLVSEKIPESEESKVALSPTSKLLN